MPEIALTAQFLGRFASRFGARPGGMAFRRQRAEARAAVERGGARRSQGRYWRALGAVSSFADLATLIVDEEHEAAYKQEEGAAYHARDMAVVRGQIEKAAVVLVSATPSIESRVNAANGRYTHLRLAARFKAKALPAIAAIDLRAEAAPRGNGSRQG